MQILLNVPDQKSNFIMEVLQNFRYVETRPFLPDTSRPEQKKVNSKEYLQMLDELCGSVKDPTFVEPLDVPFNMITPREEIL